METICKGRSAANDKDTDKYCMVLLLHMDETEILFVLYKLNVSLEKQCFQVVRIVRVSITKYAA